MLGNARVRPEQLAAVGRSVRLRLVKEDINKLIRSGSGKLADNAKREDQMVQDIVDQLYEPQIPPKKNERARTYTDKTGSSCTCC